MPKSRITCCVKNCKNTPAKVEDQDPPISFYSFPSASIFVPWQAKRRMLWINAVRKYSNYSEDWEPPSSAKICSAHFVDNKKSNHPQHPSYAPTIFPGVQSKEPHLSLARFNKHQRRLNNQFNGRKKIQERKKTKSDICEMETNIHPETESVMVLDTCIGSSSVGCQTDFDEEPEDVYTNVNSFCLIEKENNTCTSQIQITTDMKVVTHQATSADIVSKKSSKEVGCDPIQPMLNGPKCQGFHGFDSVKDDEQLSSLTGLSLNAFHYIIPLLPDTKCFKLRKKNKLLLFLMKLKLGISFTALAVLFGIHRTSVHRTFIKLLESYKIILKEYIVWPPKKIIQVALPEAFKIHYPNTRVIIDCTEVKTQMPSTVESQVLMYSSYKSHHTAKFLIGITPYGLISFVSECYGGRASDSFITVDSRLFDLLEPGDVVMADKGFPTIRTDIENRRAIFVMPPQLENDQLSPEEVENTYNIASVRIHVERVIQRIKDFHILRKMPIKLLPYTDEIVFVICAMTNIRHLILKEKNNVN